MSHYGKEYWDWQKQKGKVGGYLNKFKFEQYITKDVSLLDFGCGGGFLLDQFDVKKKFGFEINEYCYEQLNKFNIKVFNKYEDISDNMFDIIISNHAIEHVPNPFETLKHLHRILKAGGKIILVIPCEQALEKPNISFLYKEDDINQHLYTWSPQSFGNLTKLAGFKIISCEVFQHQWAPGWETKNKNPNFHKICKKYAKKNNNFQIKLVATK